MGDELKLTISSVSLSSDQDAVDFGDIPVHVLTTVIKAFFRELREPLITYELYENFIHVSGREGGAVSTPRRGAGERGAAALPERGGGPAAQAEQGHP